MEALAAAAGALEVSALGAWARGSPQAYPLLNLAHLLGLVMLVGGVGVLDLRLAGLGRSLPAVPLSRLLTPVAAAGLGLMAASGAVMFAADAGPLLGSATFRWKLLLIGLALGNALLFRLLWGSRLALWENRRPPALGAVMAAGSLLLWLAAGAMGRLIAYT